MKALTGQKIITCLIPKEHSKALEVAKALHDEKGINSTSVGSGRGSGLAKLTYGSWVEVDILTVIVSERQADEVFAFILDKADINRPHGGFIFQGELAKVTPFTLPDIPDEDQAG